MKRIGTTTGGGALIEFTCDEVASIQAAMALLDQITAEDEPAAVVPARAPAPIASQQQLVRDAARVSYTRPAAKKPTKPAKRAAADGKRICTKCGKEKPASEFYTGHGKCKPCFKLHSNELKDKGTMRAERKKAGLDVVARVEAKVKAGGSFLARERDPALDRPVSSGRVLPVGGEG